MGNLLNAFVNSGATAGVNPVAARANALSVQGQQQNNQMNALKLADYPQQQQERQQTQDFQNAANAVNLAMKMPSEEEANAFLEKTLPGKGVKVAFDKQTASWSGAQGTLTGPKALLADWADFLATNPQPDQATMQTHIAAILRAGGSWTAAKGIGAEKQAELDVSKANNEASNKARIEAAKIGATSRENVADKNAEARITTIKTKAETAVAAAKASGKLPSNVTAAIDTIRVYSSRLGKATQENAYTLLNDMLVQNGTISATAKEDVKSQLTPQEQAIYDQAVTTVSDFFKGGQSATPATTTTPSAEKYTVDKIYTDANGRKAKYMGAGKWQIQP